MSLTYLSPSEVVYNLDKSAENIEDAAAAKGSASSEQPTGPAPKQSQPNKPKRVRMTFESSDRQRDEEMLLEKVKKKKENIQKRKEEFLEKGLLTTLHGQIEQKVQGALLSTEHLLADKRTRLRELLLAEEIAYTAEYVGICQQMNAKKEEEFKARAMKLKQQKERERQEFAEKKRMEQKILSCDAARPIWSQKAVAKLKEDQLWQIKEKYAMAEARKEEDRMYHDIMLKNMDALKENDEEVAKLNWRKQREAQEAFAEQLKVKEQKELEMRQLKEFERQQLEEELRLLKGEGEKEKEEQRLKKEKLKTEARELLVNAMALKERRRREEEEIDQTFSALMRIEEEKEKRKEKSNKERLKQEMDIFIAKSRELKELKEKEERKIDELIEEFNERRRKDKDMERRKLRDARDELFQSVMRGREQQIREKQARERNIRECEMREMELMELQIEQHKRIRDEYERKCAEERQEYKENLLKQIAEVQEKRKKCKEEEEEYNKMKKEEEEGELEEVMQMLKKMPFDFVDHPFKTVIDKNPPKYPCLYPYLK